MGVFGADNFRPFGRAAPIKSGPISYGGRQGSCEDAFILNSELELQVLALIVGIGGQRSPTSLQILFCVAFYPLSRGFVIEQTITFDHMQRLGIRRAEP